MTSTIEDFIEAINTLDLYVPKELIELIWDYKKSIILHKGINNLYNRSIVTYTELPHEIYLDVNILRQLCN